jgi:hypothetical protein
MCRTKSIVAGYHWSCGVEKTVWKGHDFSLQQWNVLICTLNAINSCIYILNIYTFIYQHAPLLLSNTTCIVVNFTYYDLSCLHVLHHLLITCAVFFVPAYFVYKFFEFFYNTVVLIYYSSLAKFLFLSLLLLVFPFPSLGEGS